MIKATASFPLESRQWDCFDFHHFLFGYLFELQTGIISSHTANATFTRFNGWLQKWIGRDIQYTQGMHLTDQLWNPLQHIVRHLERPQTRPRRGQILWQIRQIIIPQIQILQLGQQQ